MPVWNVFLMCPETPSLFDTDVIIVLEAFTLWQKVVVWWPGGGLYKRCTDYLLTLITSLKKVSL